MKKIYLFAFIITVIGTLAIDAMEAPSSESIQLIDTQQESKIRRAEQGPSQPIKPVASLVDLAINSVFKNLKDLKSLSYLPQELQEQFIRKKGAEKVPHTVGKYLCHLASTVEEYQRFASPICTDIEDDENNNSLNIAIINGNNYLFKRNLISAYRKNNNLLISPFVQAIRYQDKNLVTHILSFYYNTSYCLNPSNSFDKDFFDEKDALGRTALFYAIRYMPEIVETLLTRGVNVAITDCYGNTPLQWVFLYCPADCKETVFELLVSHGATGQQHTFQAPAQLEKKSPHQMKHFIQSLLTLDDLCNALNNGFNCNEVDNQETPFIHHCIALQRPELALYLIKHKLCNLESPDEFGITPLIQALKYEYEDIAQAIIDYFRHNYGHGAALIYQINYKDQLARNALYYALQYIPNLVETLILLGADVNLIDKQMNNPLIWALEKNPDHCHKLKIVQLLVNAGADIHYRNNYTSILLSAARMSAEPLIIKLLVDAGAVVNEVVVNDIIGETTPLQEAARDNPYPGMLLALINDGADLSFNNQGEGALFCAIREGENALEKAKILLQCTTFSTQALNKALLHSTSSCQEDITLIQLLLDNNANVNYQATEDDLGEESAGNTPLHCAADGGYTKTITLLLTKNANLEARNDYGNTPLLEAATANAASIALLLENNCDKYAQNNDNETALLFALKNLDYEAIYLLIDNQSTNMVNNKGKSPLIIACKNYAKARSQKEYLNPIIILLLKNGADIKHKDNKGKTALDYFKESKSLDSQEDQKILALLISE